MTTLLFFYGVMWKVGLSGIVILILSFAVLGLATQVYDMKFSIKVAAVSGVMSAIAVLLLVAAAGIGLLGLIVSAAVLAFA